MKKILDWLGEEQKFETRLGFFVYLAGIFTLSGILKAFWEYITRSL